MQPTAPLQQILAPKLFLGLTTTRRRDWEQLLAEPVATRSTKEDSVKKEIAEKRRVQEEQAQFFPFTGSVTACVLLDRNGAVVMDVKNSGDDFSGILSADVLATIEAYYQRHSIQPRTTGDNTDIGVSLFGFNIKERMRLLAVDAMQAQYHRPDYKPPHVGLWSHKTFEAAPWCDPYDVIVPTDHRNNFTWLHVAKYLGINVAGADTIDSNPMLQAELARQFAVRAGLIN